MREQRRLAAIVAVDVVGFSRLMGRDERGTLARLLDHRKRRLEPIVARHGGRVVKLTGDGALIEFASVVEAVSAAISFQQAVAETGSGAPGEEAIVFRIGAHLGDLIVEGDDLYGDGVNVAARLEAEAPAGGVVISHSVRDAVDGRLKATLLDLGDLTLKNIERPVRAFRVAWSAADWQTPAAATAAPSDAPLALPDKPSIAVLPFANMSGDPEQEYFTDGISEDIITELSRFRDLFVIARNSSFSYKGKSPDIRQVGRELGVRYVLEGSIRRAANRVRVTAQLIDSITGSHVWAERYDRVLDDIFAVQEEVTRAIVSAIAPEIAANEHTLATRRRPDDLGAHAIALRAWADTMDAHASWNGGQIASAIHHAERALAIDPTNVLALQSSAFAHGIAAFNGFTDDIERSRREAAIAASRAVSLDSANARSYALRAFSVFLARDHDRHPDALIDARRAQAINPNDTFVLYVLANLESSVGEPQDAVDLAMRILRLNPRDSRSHMIYTLLAFTCCRMERYDDAVAWASRALNDAPDNSPALMNLLVGLVGIGDIANARAVFAKERERRPALLSRTGQGKGAHGLRAVRERYRHMLRIAAGLEEPSP